MAAPRRLTTTAARCLTLTNPSNPGPSTLRRPLSTTSHLHSSSPDTPSTTPSLPPLRASLLLSRPPLLLREPTTFESAYFTYNTNLRRALSRPFPRELYFKKGSAAEAKFLEEEKKRDQEMRRGAEEKKKDDAKAKGDNNKGGENNAAPQTTTTSGEDMYEALPRITEADKKGDTTSLQRKLDRTLFLVVRGVGSGGAKGQWRFPDNELSVKVDSEGKVWRENLHVAAPEGVKSLLGRDMDIWLVSNMPVGMLSAGQGVEDKTYFLKAHILAGSPSPSESSGEKVEYAWLTRQELEEHFAGGENGEEGEGRRRGYWEGVKGLLED